jgi:cobalt-zinc-cadmium efflux system outer membrane protein
MCPGILLAGYLAGPVFAQQPLTWQQVRGRFQANNPTLKAARLGIDESRQDEVTAYLRPNPTATAITDELGLFTPNPYRPLSNGIYALSVDYLHEREHKRELRLQSAREGTAIARSQRGDLERNLVYNLRTAFVQTLQAKAVLQLAKESLAFYDKELGINHQRFQAGDIARIDMNRLELQRAQFQSDVINAQVNLRTAKIQLLQLMNEKTPVDQFDITGPFDFDGNIRPLDQIRNTALDARPDLRAAVQSIEQARTNHQLAVANGSTDPTFGADVGRQPPLNFYAGVSVSIPLRIFDRNQGEKARTQIEVGRTERLRDATETAVLSDVDSAYATVMSTVELLKPYKDQYLRQATDVRETMSFSYTSGGASLLDFLDAQNQYRTTQLTYLNLIGSYLSAANQLNFAVGREVIQ